MRNKLVKLTHKEIHGGNLTVRLKYENINLKCIEEINNKIATFVMKIKKENCSKN